MGPRCWWTCDQIIRPIGERPIRRVISEVTMSIALKLVATQVEPGLIEIALVAPENTPPFDTVGRTITATGALPIPGSGHPGELLLAANPSAFNWQRVDGGGFRFAAAVMKAGAKVHGPGVLYRASFWHEGPCSFACDAGLWAAGFALPSVTCEPVSIGA